MKHYLNLKSKIKNLPFLKSEFNRNVLTLTSGTAIAQAIPILVSPILTRLYSPSDFGTLALFISITSIVSVISCGRYELAIMLPEKDEDAINVAAVAFIFNVVTSFLFLLFIIFLGDWLLKVLKAESLKGWIYLAPLTVFFMGIFNILNYTNNRFKLYKDIAKANVYKSVAMSVLQIAVASLKVGAVGLLSGHIFSQFVANAKLLKNIFMRNKLTCIDFKEIKFFFKRYINFPKYSMWAGLMNVCAYQIVNLLIGSYYGQIALGHYYLAQRVLLTPSVFVGTSISQVFFKKAVDEKNETGKTIQTFKNTLKKLLIISAPVFFITFLFVKPIFTLIFGKEWANAGLYAMILTPMYAVRFVSSVLSMVYIICEYQKIEIIINFIIILVSIVGIFIFYSMLSYLYFISVILCISYLAFIFIYRKLSLMGNGYERIS